MCTPAVFSRRAMEKLLKGSPRAQEESSSLNFGGPVLVASARHRYRTMTKAAPSSSSPFHSDKLRVPAAAGGSSSLPATSNSDASPASTPVKGDGGVPNKAAAPPPEDSSSSLSDSLRTRADATLLMYPVPLFRSHVLRLSALVGQLSAVALQHMPLDEASRNVPPPSPPCPPLLSAEAKAAMTLAASDVWLALVASSTLLSLRLPRSILEKMELNRRKYPAELCRGKAGKYTEYSDATGITKDHGQTTSLSGAASRPASLDDAEIADGCVDDDACDPCVVRRLTATIREFAAERQWSKFHLPRNLVLALLGELGELAELVQWDGDVDQNLTPPKLDKLSQELADVAIYLLRLVDVCGVTIDTDGAAPERM